ncbi:MAG: 30S ribosomal protein S6e [Nanoarchaeota archaeon]|nr:30S ribosomal protein S6e [Nanoarchaeota archaeon]
MVFKINISNKEGKTYKTELECESLIDKKIKDKLSGKDLLPDLEGYEFEITGASDKAGFPALENVEGSILKKVLLIYGRGMKKHPKREGKKKYPKNRPGGLRLRKTVRGNTISSDVTQINLKVLKAGNKPLSDIFPEQNKPKEKQNRAFKRKHKKSEAEKPSEQAEQSE